MNKKVKTIISSVLSALIIMSLFSVSTISRNVSARGKGDSATGEPSTKRPRLENQGAGWINFVDCNGNTTLIRAVMDNNLSEVQFLLNQGVNVDACNNDGETALIVAAWKGNRKIAERLITNNANVNFRDIFGFTALRAAIMSGNLDVAKYLINVESINVNIRDMSGETVLNYIRKMRSCPEMDLVGQIYAEIENLLLERGATE